MLRSSHDACGCSTQTTSTINLKRSTLHPHEGQADRPNTPSDSDNPGSNPGPPAKHTGFFRECLRETLKRDHFMTDYFSDREQGSQPRTKEAIDEIAWQG